MGLLENLQKSLDSPEGKKSMEDWFKKHQAQEDMEESQMNRFHQKYSCLVSPCQTCSDRLNEFIEKVITKYSSNKYRDNWYNRGIEPTEALYWFLFKYAQKYGREATTEEYETIGNMFTSVLYIVGNYSFNRMDGQGSCIIVKKY